MHGQVCSGFGHHLSLFKVEILTFQLPLPRRFPWHPPFTHADMAHGALRPPRYSLG